MICCSLHDESSCVDLLFRPIPRSFFTLEQISILDSRQDCLGSRHACKVPPYTFTPSPRVLGEKDDRFSMTAMKGGEGKMTIRFTTCNTSLNPENE